LQAVILAAGEGNRMRPLTFNRPKVMLPIANKPIIEHLLIEARQAGINDYIFIVGYHDEQLRDYFGRGDKWGVSIEYCTQKKRLGTADAIRMAESLIDGNFLVMNGDIIVRRNEIFSLSNRHENTISLFRTTDGQDLGMVESSADRVVHIYEKTVKPPSFMANAGLYLFTPDIFSFMASTPKSPRGEYEITDTLQMLIDNMQRVSYMEINGWLDVSHPWDLLSANQSLLSTVEAQNYGDIENNTVLQGAVSIGTNTKVRSGSYIVGPVIIGDNCDIGPNCYIRPYTAIGDNCRIGSAVEIKSSIIMKNSKIPHHNYIGDSIIGEECNLGAGTKIANLRLDGNNITVGGIDTKRRKLGAIIGDGVETGINACINIGTVIGNNAQIGPGALASGVILPNARVF